MLTIPPEASLLCRRIPLINVCYKVLTNILHSQLVPFAEEIFGVDQCGFRKGQSSICNSFLLRCIIDKFSKLNLNLHLLFIDFSRPMTQQ
jgi:hypothetical protein